MLDLFGDDELGRKVEIGAQAFWLPEFALADERKILAAVDSVIRAAPFRQMQTRGGYTMSVAMSNCGELGWTSDERGYRYAPLDPLTDTPWPAMPSELLDLAVRAAEFAGFDGFCPDACLINRYLPESRLSLHQDKDEADFAFPIVSVSLGMAAVFQFGGVRRNDPIRKLTLQHGDVVVWGGASRLCYHGILPLRGAPHRLVGEQRLNLTFRKAGK